MLALLNISFKLNSLTQYLIIFTCTVQSKYNHAHYRDETIWTKIHGKSQNVDQCSSKLVLFYTSHRLSSFLFAFSTLSSQLQFPFILFRFSLPFRAIICLSGKRYKDCAINLEMEWDMEWELWCLLATGTNILMRL